MPEYGDPLAGLGIPVHRLHSPRTKITINNNEPVALLVSGNTKLLIRHLAAFQRAVEDAPIVTNRSQALLALNPNNFVTDATLTLSQSFPKVTLYSNYASINRSSIKLIVVLDARMDDSLDSARDMYRAYWESRLILFGVNGDHLATLTASTRMECPPADAYAPCSLHERRTMFDELRRKLNAFLAEK